jgi:hypothetical protein
MKTILPGTTPLAPIHASGNSRMCAQVNRPAVTTHLLWVIREISKAISWCVTSALTPGPL